MANLIQVNSYSKLANQETSALASSVLIINVKNIISVSTRATAYNTDGITNVLYELPVNQVTYQINLVVKETAAAVLGLANAALVSA